MCAAVAVEEFCVSWAATQLTMRSAPTSVGLSVRMGRPVLDAGLDERAA